MYTLNGVVPKQQNNMWNSIPNSSQPKKGRGCLSTQLHRRQKVLKVIYIKIQYILCYSNSYNKEKEDDFHTLKLKNSNDYEYQPEQFGLVSSP